MKISGSYVLRIIAVGLLLSVPVMMAAAQEPDSTPTETSVAPSDATSTDTQPADATSDDRAPADETATEPTSDEGASDTAKADRGPRMGAYGVIEKPPEVIKSAGAINDWFFNMFSALSDQPNKLLFVTLYLVTVIGLVVVRTAFDNPIKLLGCALLYTYSLLQTFSLFKASHWITDYSHSGWPTTAKSLWFATVFTAAFVWGVSRIAESVAAVAMGTGLGAALGLIDPRKWLDKFRKSDAELEELDGGSAKNPKKQNTAIMFTDIVGYSAQMGKNEAAMVAKLQIHNEIMRNQIVRNRGTVIKTIGDAFMVRFRSAESAVQCALDCQKAIGEYNKTKTPEDQFHIRIGCHMGEVIHTGTDVFGEGVNIAARIEPKCDPDGVTVSDVIANAARNKVPAHFSSIGRPPMKNIANPPELFKVFPIEAQAVQKVQKTAAGGAAAGAAASSGTPGGTFKI